jgi:hypothetical protein
VQDECDCRGVEEWQRMARSIANEMSLSLLDGEDVLCKMGMIDILAKCNTVVISHMMDAGSGTADELIAAIKAETINQIALFRAGIDNTRGGPN